MAIARDTTAANIKPLEGHIVRRFTAGAAIAAGELVSMKSDGFIDPSNSTAAADPVVGVAVKAAAVGDRVDVVVFGPIKCLTGATPGTTVYNSTTAGEPGATASGNETAAGWAEAADVLFVNPA